MRMSSMTIGVAYGSCTKLTINARKSETFIFSTKLSQLGLSLNHFDLIPVEKNRNKHFEPNIVYLNRRTDFD